MAHSLVEQVLVGGLPAAVADLHRTALYVEDLLRAVAFARQVLPRRICPRLRVDVIQPWQISTWRASPASESLAFFFWRSKDPRVYGRGVRAVKYSKNKKMEKSHCPA